MISFLPYPQPLILIVVETRESKITSEQKGNVEAFIKGSEVEGMS